MPFQIPTVQDLAERTANAFRAWLKGSDARLWPNNVAVSAKVMAGTVWEAYGFLVKLSKIPFVHLCPGEFLDRHGRDYGLSRRAAAHARGTITITAPPGTILVSGAVLSRVDGVRYATIAPVTVSGTGSATVGVEAVEAGRAGNAASGVTLTLDAPIAGVTVVVSASAIGAGDDVESDESYRARILFRKRYPPHGGAAHDYVAWAREVGGVTRVFVDPVTRQNGRTTVAVYPLFDDTRDNGIPQSSDLAAVEAHIDTVRPAAAHVSIVAPIVHPIDISVTNLNPYTTAVIAAVGNELADLILRDARVSTLAEPYVLSRSRIAEAISAATGERSHDLVLPTTNIIVPAGRLPVIGAVTLAA